MKFGNIFRSSIAASAVMLMASAVQADPQTFFGETTGAAGVFPTSSLDISRKAERDFQDAMNVLQTETFNGASKGYLGLAGNSMRVLSDGTLTQADGIEFDESGFPNLNKGVETFTDSATTEAKRFNTTGGTLKGNWIESDTDFTINVGIVGGVGGFGFYGTDFGDFDGGLVIELFLGGKSVVANAFVDKDGKQLVPLAADSGSLLFFGWASDRIKFDRIDFKIGQKGNLLDVLGFDDIMIGNLKNATVPEPGSLALVSLALFAAGWARKTQRRA
jgi:PEP-CTERM motif